MKTYKETKEAVKQLILIFGIDSLLGYDINRLVANGHNTTNIQNAINYFQYSPQAKKYRTN